VRYGRKLLAISQDGGNVLWTRKDKFPSLGVQFASTPEALLARGAYNLDGNGRTETL
jgi:hypothetical protein